MDFSRNQTRFGKQKLYVKNCLETNAAPFFFLNLFSMSAMRFFLLFITHMTFFILFECDVNLSAAQLISALASFFTS